MADEKLVEAEIANLLYRHGGGLMHTCQVLARKIMVLQAKLSSDVKPKIIPYGMKVDVEWFDRGAQKLTVTYGDIKRFALVRHGDDLDAYIGALIDEVAHIAGESTDKTTAVPAGEAVKQYRWRFRGSCTDFSGWFEGEPPIGPDLETETRTLYTHPAPEKEKAMSEKDYTNPSGAQIPGYRQQSQANLEVVKFHKEWEERTLRHLDWLREQPGVDQRWLQMGRSNIEVAFMEVNRAVMQPQRIALPEDAEPEKLAYNQKPPVQASQGGDGAQGSRAAGQGDHAKGDAEK